MRAERECTGRGPRSFGIRGPRHVGEFGMNGWKRKRFLGLLLMLLAAQGGVAQPAAPTAPSASTAPSAVRVDFKGRRVTVQARVCKRDGTMELLLCGQGTKEYQSILVTSAPAHDVHAALLALGLDAGKPARWSDPQADQPPRLLPPRGAELTVRLRWRNPHTGEVRQADASEFLSAPRPSSGRRPKTWIFIGSALSADNRYEADMDGNVISLSNFGSSVIDVPFESSSDDSLLEFQAATAAIPPLGTAVEVILAPLPGAEAAAHARGMVDLDEDGRAAVDGKKLDGEELTEWARRFLLRHSCAEVELRIAGETRAWDIEQARRAIQIGGIVDVRQEVLPPPRRAIAPPATRPSTAPSAPRPATERGRS